jgi:hypothetical protein
VEDLPLRPAAVVEAGDEACVVAAAGRRWSVGYAEPFRARAAELLPGHLVAVVADGPDDVVVWRWFDAVVLDVDADGVELWEPLHGRIRARARGVTPVLRPGTRAYASAGLPGADWWVAGPAGCDPAEADVELDEVRAFYSANDLWSSLRSAAG